MQRTFLPVIGALVLIASLASPAFAQYYEFSISNAPPAPRYEVAPGPRDGYIWAPGYWNWYHSRYTWVPGRWVEHRPGYAWSNEHWERHGNKWKLARGHWDHDPHWQAHGDRDWHGDHDGNWNHRSEWDPGNRDWRRNHHN